MTIPHFKASILFACLFFVTIFSYSQHSLIGIQGTSRKGIIHAAMNPAELNHLSREVEFNLFAVGATASNNVITFDDIINEDELLDLAFDHAEGPIDIKTEVQVIGPSFGFKVDKWSFGVISQILVKGDIMELDADLGSSFLDGNVGDRMYEVDIKSTSNQRLNTAAWAEFGLMAGREIWANENQILTIGGTFKFLAPGTYINLGLNNLQGKFVQNQEKSGLSGAQGTLNMSYPPDLEDWDLEEQALNRFSLNSISGFAVDLGISHQWKKDGVPKISSGLSIKNLGGLNFGPDQVINSYAMDIPENEFFRLDTLEGDLEEIEAQLLGSGYFTKTSQTGNARSNLPTMVTAYTDIKVSRIFQISVYGQSRLSSQNGNTRLTNQNVFAITPRLTFRGFEIYSPWTSYEVSGITGGVGLRLGGFFLGSNSVLTGLLANSKQIDVHVGMSLGFGKTKSTKTYGE